MGAPDTPPVTIEIAGDHRARVSYAIKRAAWQCEQAGNGGENAAFDPAFRAQLLADAAMLRSYAAHIAPEGGDG